MILHEPPIAALATPPGASALAVIRVSGSGCLDMLEPLVISRPALADRPGGTQSWAKLAEDGGWIDDVMLSVHRAPRSYTGEDTVEISCHGNPTIVSRILSALFRAGIQLAQPGEFTRRAWMNGKMDLTQAEAVMDLIQAGSDLALRSAQQQLAGGWRQRFEEVHQRLLEIIAEVEAAIDFPEEGIEPEGAAALIQRCIALSQQLNDYLSSAERGRTLREGLRIALVGAPNAGKSSLLNILLERERALVSPIPGTTRDYLEEQFSLEGLPVRLVDTAGLRDGAEAVEQAGMAMTQEIMASADFILCVYDGSQPPPATLLPRPADRSLLVLNKIDLPVHPDWTAQPGLVRISCQSGAGLKELRQTIKEQVWDLPSHLAAEEQLLAVNARHAASLALAKDALEQAAQGLKTDLEPELVAVELRSALAQLEHIVGLTDPDAVLDLIFSKFCLGK